MRFLFFELTILIITIFDNLNLCSPVSISTQTNIQYIYSPFPSQEYTISNLQATSNRIVYNQEQNILVTSWGNAGLSVFSIASNSQEYLFASANLIRGLAVTSNGLYIIFFFESKVQSFFYNRTSNQKEFEKRGASDTLSTEVFDIILSQDETVAIVLLSNSEISVYDIRQKTVSQGYFQLLNSISSLSNIVSRGLLSLNENYLFIANDYSGLVIFKFNKVIEQNSPKSIVITLSLHANVPTDWQLVDAVITSDQKYIYAADCWSGIQVVYTHSDDISTQQWVPELVNKNYWPSQTSTTPFTLKLTNDNNFLLVGAREQGVLILDITDQKSPVLFQKIPVSGHAFSVQLTNQDSKLFFSNGSTIQLFQKVSPNLNTDYPNLYNNHISRVYPISNYQYRWRCYVSSDNTYFFGAFDRGGLFVYSLKNNPNNSSDSNPFNLQPVNQLSFVENTSIDSILFFTNADLIFLAVSQENSKIFVYRLSEVIKLNNTSLQPIFKMPFSNAGSLSETLVANSDQSMIAVVSDSSFLLINSTNPISLQIISQFFVPTMMIGTCSSILFSRDSQFIILAVRNYGFLSVNIRNPHRPVLGDYLQTLGGEFILNAITSDNYAFLSDGYKGFVALDLSKLPSLKLVRYQVDGWLNHITPYNLNSYLILSHMDSGYISLLKVTDRDNPLTLTKAFFGNQNAMCSCLTPDNKYVFVANNMGVNTLPLFSEVTIHTQILLKNGIENGQISYTLQDSSTQLAVGSIYVFQFIPIYPRSDLIFSSIQYYSSEDILVNLPYWITPLLSSAQVQITSVKDALGTNVSLPNLNQIVVIFKTSLTSSSFLYSDIGDGVSTSQSQANSIYQFLMNSDLISVSNYTSSMFDSQQYINFAGLSLGGMEQQTAFQERVKITMLRSIQKNPIMFYIAPSLSFNITSGKISSLSSQIGVYLTIDTSQGSFIPFSYDGVLSSFNSGGSSIKLEGNADALNNVFQSQKIIYFTNETNFAGVPIQFYLSDGINYDISDTYSLLQLSVQKSLSDNNTYISSNSILRIKKKVILNPLQKSLQQQFDSFYSDSQVPVEENVSFEFSQSTFVSPDGLSLSYSVLFQNGNGQFTNSMSSSWLQQSSDSLKFQGTPPLSLFNSVLRVKVIATDGYDVCEDIFSIEISSIPFSYILNLLLKILSPIAAFIGIYTNRNFFFNAIFQDRNIYSTEHCPTNSLFCMKIALLGEENEKAILLFNSMKKHMNLSERKKLIRKRIMRKNKSVIVYGLSVNSLRDEDNPKQRELQLVDVNMFSENPANILSFEEQNGVGSPKYMLQNQQISNIIGGNEFSNNNLQMVSYIQEKNSFDNYNIVNNINNVSSSNNNTLSNHNNLNLNNSKKLQRANPMSELRKNQIIFLNRMSSLKKQRTMRNPIEEQFTRVDGSLRFSKIIQYMIQEKLYFSYKNEIHEVRSLIKDLKDEKSRLYKCLRAVVARYLLSFDEKTELFLEFLREEALNHFNYTEKDWYKHYVEIQSSPSIVNEQLEIICFPQVSIRKDTIRQSLINLRIISHNDDMEKFVTKEMLNLRLLYEILIAETLGLLDEQPSIFSKSQGESIHLNFFEISSIEAFKPIKNPNCSFLRRLLNLTLAKYGASQNMKLPNWIKFDQKSSCLILQGNPTASDIEEIVIRIFDNQHYIIREFPLRIVDEDREVQMEFDYESAKISTRNFNSKNQAYSETNSPTYIYNSTNQQSKPSIFSNIPSLLNGRLNKMSQHKRESHPQKGIEEEEDIHQSNNQVNSPNGIQEEEQSSESQAKSNVIEKFSLYEQKEEHPFPAQHSKIEDSLESVRNSPNQIPTQKRKSAYLEERYSRNIKSINEDTLNQQLTLNSSSPKKQKKGLSAREFSQKSREKEEFDIELQLQPMTIKNQFSNQESVDGYLNHQDAVLTHSKKENHHIQ